MELAETPAVNELKLEITPPKYTGEKIEVLTAKNAQKTIPVLVFARQTGN